MSWARNDSKPSIHFQQQQPSKSHFPIDLLVEFTVNSLSQWTLKKKSLNFIFPTKYVIPKSLKFSHWPSKVKKQLFFFSVEQLFCASSFLWDFHGPPARNERKKSTIQPLTGAIFVNHPKQCIVKTEIPQNCHTFVSSWWLNHPFEKYAQVKLDHLPR